MSTSNRGRQLNTPYNLFVEIYGRISEWNNLYTEDANDTNNEDTWRKNTANRIREEVLVAQNFPFYKDGSATTNTTSRTNMEKVALRFLTFYSMISISALCLHTGGIFSAANGLIAEFTAGLGRSGTSNSVKKGSLDLNKIEKKLGCWRPWNLIHRQGRAKITNPRFNANEYFIYCMGNSCRGWLQATILHSSSILEMFLSKIYENKTSPEPIHPASIMENIKPTYENYIAVGLDYELKMQTMNYFRQNIWIQVIDEVMHMGHGIYDEWIMTIPEDNIIRPSKIPRAKVNTSYKRFIRDQNSGMDHQYVLTNLFSTNPIVVDAWGVIMSKMFEIILHYGAGRASEMRGDTFTNVYALPIRTVLLSILDLIIGTAVKYNAEIETSETRIDFEILNDGERRQAWVNAVLNNIRDNPARHLDEEQLAEQLQDENAEPSVELQAAEPPPPPPLVPLPIPTRNANDPPEWTRHMRTDDEVHPGLDDENVVEIDATVRRVRDEIQEERRNTIDIGNVTVLIVKDPPPECLDGNNKCKSCGIDWGKLSGRVQIMRCPSEANVDNLSNAMTTAVRNVQDRVRRELQRQTNQQQGRRDDQNGQQNRQVQVHLPAGEQESESVVIDSSFQDGMIQVPLSVISGNGDAQSGGSVRHQHVDPGTLMQSIPDVMLKVFAKLLSGFKFLPNVSHTGNQTRPVVPLLESPSQAEGPSEVNVTITQQTPAEDEIQPEDPQRRREVRLQVSRRTVSPVVTEEVINAALDTVGMGDTNPNVEPAFSVTESLQDQREYNDRIENGHIGHTYCGEFRVDDKNVLAPEFSLIALLCHWSLTSKFHHTIMESIEVWASRCLRFTSGPLLQNGRSHAYDNQTGGTTKYPVYGNLDEFIGTQNVCFAHSIYNTIQSAIKKNSIWRSQNYVHRAVPITDNRIDNEVTYITFNNQLANRHQRNYATYDVVVCHVFGNFPAPHIREGLRVPHTEGLVPLRRFLGLIIQADPNTDEENNLVETVEVMVIQNGQLSNVERMYADRKAHLEELKLPGPTLHVATVKDGYIGSQVRLSSYLRYDDQHPSISSLTPYQTNVVFNQNTFHQHFQRITPFNDTLLITDHQYRDYVNNSSLGGFEKAYLRSIMGLGNINIIEEVHLPEGYHQEAFIMEQDLPNRMNSSQLTAVQESITFVKNIHNGNQFKPNIFGILGPPGTGKTTTVMNILSTYLNGSKRAKSIMDVYDYIETLKNGQHPRHLQSAPQTLPEDEVRVLVLTETNSALDTIERQLNAGLLFQVDVQPGEHNGEDNRYGIRRIVPLYTRVSLKHDRMPESEDDNQNALPPEQQEMYAIPHGVRRCSSGCITLSTFGSIKKAFKDLLFNQTRNRTRRPQYDLIIIDEASQVCMVQLVALFCELNYGGCKKNYAIVIAGDHHQQLPVVIGRGSTFTDLGTVSIMDVLLASSSLRNNSSDLCPSIMLNIQYRMNDTISSLANYISGRDVMNAEHQDLDHIVQAEPLLTNDNMDKIRDRNADLSTFEHPIVWVDPYWTSTTRIQRFIPNRREQNMSSTEAGAVVCLVEAVVDHNIYRPDQILILSPYNIQIEVIRNLLRARQAVRAMSTDPFVQSRMDINTVQLKTLATIQGGERDCVIISPARYKNEVIGPRQQNRRRTIGIAGSVNSIYVGLTRATQQLFIVGDYTHLSRFSPWDRIGYFLKTFAPEEQRQEYQ